MKKARGCMAEMDGLAYIKESDLLQPSASGKVMVAGHVL